jgi:N-acetylmuramoyl-L-alanine amidase
MTRNNDMKVTMSERIKFANSVGADLFISIHVNKTKKKHVSGIETYYLDTTNRTYLSNFFNKNNIETKKQKLKYLLANMNIESDTKKSFKLGKLIQESIIINMQNINHKINDLGLTSTMFYVLSGVKMPSILIGFSLFDEKKENITLLNKYKKLFSLGLVCAIKSYIDSEVCSCIP